LVRNAGRQFEGGAVQSSVVADAWLFWLALSVAIVFLVLFAVAGYAVMGLVLLGAIVLSGRAALAPSAREDTDDALRRACDRLPFCDCAPSGRR
jgi:hypothetical protein